MTRQPVPGYTADTMTTTHSRITIEPGKCGGKPCIRGMRIRVCDVLELLANGASIEEILADYPCLERDDILAAIAYAALIAAFSSSFDTIVAAFDSGQSVVELI